MRIMDQKGFSLVEISIIVAILGILAAIAVPSFRGVMPRVRLGNNTVNLANTIATTRMAAIAKSTDRCITFDTANDRYSLGTWTQANASTGNCAVYATSTMNGTDLASATGFKSTVAPQAGDPDAAVLVFRAMGPVGVPLSTQAVIRIQTPFTAPATEGDFQRQILVEPTGRFIVQKRTLGGSWATE